VSEPEHRLPPVRELRPIDAILSPGLQKMRSWVWLGVAFFAMFLLTAVLMLGWQEGEFAVTWKRPTWFIAVVAVGPIVGAVFGMFTTVACVGFLEAVGRPNSADKLSSAISGIVVGLVVLTASVPLISYGKSQAALADATSALAGVLASDDILALRPKDQGITDEAWERTTDPFLVCATADNDLVKQRALTKGLAVQCRAPTRLDFSHTYLPAGMRATNAGDAAWIAYVCTNIRGEGWTTSASPGTVEQVRVTVVDRESGQQMMVGFVERVPPSGGKQGVMYWSRPRDVGYLISDCLSKAARARTPKVP
jgi:hypothetical protein